MKNRFSPLVPMSFLVVLCACGGGSSGTTEQVGVECDPGEYRPTAPAGLGVAGPMDGFWRAVDQQLVADPRTRNPVLEETWLSVNDQLEFRNGVVYFESPSISVGGPSTGNAIPGNAIVEFQCNEQVEGLTLYGFGWSFSSPTQGVGATRVCGIFGTTSATMAVAVLVEEQIYSFLSPPVSRFLVHEVTLEKFSPSPALLQQESDPVAVTLEPGHLDDERLR